MTDKVTKRWIKTPNDERACIPVEKGGSGCWFDEERVDHVVQFFSRFLRHSKGRFAGQSFDLLDYQIQDIIGPIFGWVRRNERGNVVRRITKAYIELPKKQGKSTCSAALGLYMLVADGERGAEVYSAATDRKQAQIVHDEAISMVKKSPELSSFLKINRTTKSIYCEHTESVYRALSNSPQGNEGWNAHAIIADELHKWKGRELYDALRYAFAAREQPLFFQITTAGDSPLSVCKEQHDYTKGVQDGTIHDERFHGAIYAAEPQDDPLDPKTWRKANPSLGVTITEESFAADAQEAAKSPTSMTAFKRYRLGIWTTGESPWLRIADWHECREDFDAEDLEGQECWAGLDLSKTQDTTSLQLIFPGEEEEYRILSYFWLPEETAQGQSMVSWQEWADAGHVILTPGNVCDYNFVFQTIQKLHEKYKIQEVAYDPWMAEHLTQRIEDEIGIPRVAFPQGIASFAGPTDEFERLILARKIRHLGNPCMDWQIGNCQVKTDHNGNKKPRKPGDKDYRKIDGPIAAIQGLGRAMENADNGSIYDKDQSERVVFL